MNHFQINGSCELIQGKIEYPAENDKAVANVMFFFALV